jgi:phosphopantothenoylcysteine decarboxylase/phosphopantothenate--cysteine ligase
LGTFFEEKNGTWHSHVSLGLWADAFIIAPASANTISKMAAGICDNLLLTTYLSARCPVFVAPAMDMDMFAHPATKKSISMLIERGCKVIEPSTGVLASGLNGKGRIEEPEIIVEKLNLFFENKEKKSLAGKKIMVTAGPTYEKIDPARFIGNFSSGKTGFAIAEELAERGATVHLIAGPVQLKEKNRQIIRTDAVTAEQMYNSVMKIFPEMDAAIMTAAVSDYRPANFSSKKIKRDSNEFYLELVANQDIAAKLGAIKKPNQFLAGFALETENNEQNAIKKLNSKNFDFIVLNSLSEDNACFNVDANSITIIDKENNITKFPLKSKIEIAIDIANEIEKKLIINN